MDFKHFGTFLKRDMIYDFRALTIFTNVLSFSFWKKYVELLLYIFYFGYYDFRLFSSLTQNVVDKVSLKTGR